MRHLLPESEEYLEYLEDDERQRRTLDDRFLREPIAVLQPATPVCAERGTSVGDVVRHADTIVIGNRLEEYRQLTSARHNGQVIIDLVRMFDQRTSDDGKYQGICW